MTLVQHPNCWQVALHDIKPLRLKRLSFTLFTYTFCGVGVQYLVYTRCVCFSLVFGLFSESSVYIHLNVFVSLLYP